MMPLLFGHPVYGSIPIDEAVESVRDLIREHENDIDLFKRHPRILSHCLENCFRFDRSYYKQCLWNSHGLQCCTTSDDNFHAQPGSVCPSECYAEAGYVCKIHRRQDRVMDPFTSGTAGFLSLHEPHSSEQQIHNRRPTHFRRHPVSRYSPIS